MMLNRLFGARIKVVGGYKAGSDIDLAMQRQEVDGRCGTHLKSIPALHPDWIRDNRLLVPIVVSEKRNTDYPDTPAIMEFVKDKTTRQTIDLLTVTQKLDRPILAPPNTPAERLNELRTALAATARDPAFLAEIKKKNLTHRGHRRRGDGEDLCRRLCLAAGRGRGGQGDHGGEIGRARTGQEQIRLAGGRSAR